ncbi:MAG: STAS domain-containing protein [Nitrospira sp.]|nr:STAS domain-containing protein [Nitrospira sp.]MCW5785388.1 STAS domain-containing protein [Nitrospirales bacterium]
MEITDHMNAGTLVLTVEGRMDFQARKAFRSAIENAKRSMPHQIILNLYHVPFIDSAGLGLLLLAYKNLEEAKIRLSLEVTEGYVRQVLTLANIGKTISISATEGRLSPSGSPRVVSASKDRLP